MGQIQLAREGHGISDFSRLRQMHKSGQLKIGEKVSLEGIVKGIDFGLGKIVLSDGKTEPLQCFTQHEKLIGVKEGDSVIVTGTYHPDTYPYSHDETFTLYGIKKSN